MISKNQLKGLCAYKQQKQCDAEQVYVVEGVKMCDEAMSWQQPVVCVAAVTSWLQTHRPRLSTVATLSEEKIFELTDADLERLSGQRTPHQVWMLLRRPDDSAVWQPAAGEGLVLALDHVQDPGNLGTIIRTADWFGVRHILCSEDTASCFNSKVVQATMGSLFRTRLHYGALVPRLERMRQSGHALIGAMLEGEDLYHMALPVAEGGARNGAVPPLPVLIIGNESQGISPEVAALVTHRVKIPNRGGTCESLNASMATAILISELLRKEEER